jgi:RES domain-containing protein
VPTAWRVVKKKHKSVAFDGEGARLCGGHWTSVGRRAVYTSSSVALATLEILVHMGLVNRPILVNSSVIYRVDIPDSLVLEVDMDALPSDWAAPIAPAQLSVIGDAWLDAREKPVLRVPSAVVPSESNFLLNPEHPAFSRLSIGPEQLYAFDSRLLDRR